MEIDQTNPINKEALIKVLENLSKAKKTFPYTALAFILKPNDLMNFLDYFGGTTIEVPTKEEFIQIVQVCLVQTVGDFDEAKAANPEVLSGLTRAKYHKLAKMLNT